MNQDKAPHISIEANVIGGIFLIEVPCAPMVPACIKLTKTNQHTSVSGTGVRVSNHRGYQGSISSFLEEFTIPCETE